MEDMLDGRYFKGEITEDELEEVKASSLPFSLKARIINAYIKLEWRKHGRGSVKNNSRAFHISSDAARNSRTGDSKCNQEPRSPLAPFGNRKEDRRRNKEKRLRKNRVQYNPILKRITANA